MKYALIVFLPLLGAVLGGFFTRVLHGHARDTAAQLITTVLLFISAILSWHTFIGVLGGDIPGTVKLFTWINSGDLQIDWALRIDTLTAVMLVVVTTVSSLVHLYSWGYMHHDKSIPRFQAYLSLFTFMMLMLVTADNFAQMFFGWEGVGLASYLLIGFWFHKDSANEASIKAFVVNRVGDFGFVLGISAVFVVFGTISFDPVFADAKNYVGQSFTFLSWDVPILEATCLLLFMGAMGKSAQLGLHTWLPDAMEGPTPVSALIHAATMVTAGVFMVARCSPMFEYAPFALDVVAFVGAATALFAATVGLVQNDIKRVIAYSTCSQLGYMFFAAGVSAYPAAVFHLFTHAFFKALLFLGAGAVIHAVSDEQDMRNMGGLRKLIPFTFAAMLIGTLALTGFPGLAGFFSKDMIIESAFAAHTPVGQFAFVLGVAAAFMTAFYSWRLAFMTFEGKPRATPEVMSHVHESPWTMLVPLAVLSVGAIFSGWYFYDYFVGANWEAFWGDSILVLTDQHHAMHGAHDVPGWVKTLPIVMGALGLLLAILMYIIKTDLPAKLAKMNQQIYQFLLNKWYFDELFDALFVKGAFFWGKSFWKSGDQGAIDAYGPDGLAAQTLAMTKRLVKAQSGFLYHYAFAMMIGVTILVSWAVYATAH